jgi:Tfp pilus assembly PilM family ATPase
MSTPTETVSNPFDGAVACRNCRSSNSPTRRFCASCGESLYEPCPQCQTEVASQEKFCGACGTNVVEAVGTLAQALEERLRQACERQKNHRFNDALAILSEVAGTSDRRFASLASKARQLMEQFAADHESLSDDFERIAAEARDDLTRFQYDQACERLAAIPEAARAPAIQELFDEARSKRKELLELSAEIRRDLAEKRQLELFPKLERLLTLKPDHAQAKVIGEKLRDAVCQAAKKKLVVHQYESASALLESISAFARDKESEKLRDWARELAALKTDIELSPTLNGPLVGLLERFVKLMPSDPAMPGLLAEARQQLTRPPADRRQGEHCRGNSPSRTWIGTPVSRWSHLLRCDIAPEATQTLAEHSGAFVTAFGLALQARQLGAVDLSLLPKEKGGLLSSLSLSLRKPQPKAGWGIDLSGTAVKAIKLAADMTDGRVRIEAAVYLPHSKPLSQIGDSLLEAEAIGATLRKFHEMHPPGKEKDRRDRTAIGISGTRTLGRFFDLPPAPAKKIPEMVQFEIKHQVPIAAADLCWGYKILREAEGKNADENSRHILLVAVRDFHVQERLAHFKSAEIPVDIVTAEPLAIHNAAAYELLADDVASVQAVPPSVSTLDVGADGCNLVVSSLDGVWFRSSGPGGNEFTRSLVKKCQLTASVAEELKKAPQKAQRFYEFGETIAPLLARLADETERSLTLFRKAFPERTVDALYLAGGAAATHGLLRQLVHGR